MTEKEFRDAAAYWDIQDSKSVKMDYEQLKQAVEAYICSNNTCALATGSGNYIRCTPLEYSYHDGCFWIFTEGGKKFIGLERNSNVCLAIYNTYKSPGGLRGMQITGRADIIEPFSPLYNAHAAYKKVSLAFLQKLDSPMHLIRITPETIDYLCSDFKKQGYASRQTLILSDKSYTDNA